jgi:hypothetical protein
MASRYHGARTRRGQPPTVPADARPKINLSTKPRSGLQSRSVPNSPYPQPQPPPLPRSPRPNVHVTPALRTQKSDGRLARSVSLLSVTRGLDYYSKSISAEPFLRRPEMTTPSRLFRIQTIPRNASRLLLQRSCSPTSTS